MAKEFGAEALEVLVSIARNAKAPAAARANAATAILDRGYGKPRQAVNIEADVTITPKPTVIEFVAPDAGED